MKKSAAFVPIWFHLMSVVHSLSGGEEVESAEEFPFMVSLREKNYDPEDAMHFCGGSIMEDTRFVLTAAHCLYTIENTENSENSYKGPKDVLAVAGTNWRLYERDSRGYEVQNWIYHEKYSKSSGGDYDIGLIRLDKRIELSPETKPIALDTTDSTSVGDEVVLLGFGKTKPDCSQNAVLLKKRSTSLVEPQKCVSRSFYNKNHFACTLADDTSHSCPGDSGGPVISVKTGVPVQVGLITRFYRKRSVTINVKVHSFAKWIEDAKAELLKSN